MGYQCCNNCHLFRSSKRNGQIDCCWKDRDENCPWVWFHPWHGDWSWIRLPVSANTYWPPQIKNIRRRISIQQKRAVLRSCLCYLYQKRLWRYYRALSKLGRCHWERSPPGRHAGPNCREIVQTQKTYFHWFWQDWRASNLPEERARAYCGWSDYEAFGVKVVGGLIIRGLGDCSAGKGEVD